MDLDYQPEAIKKKKRHPLVIFIWVLIGLIAIAAGGYLFVNYQFEARAESDLAKQDFKVEQGEGVNQISQALVEQGFLENNFYFDFYVWSKQAEDKIRAGVYELSKSMSVKEIASVLIDGSVSAEGKAVIPEGWNNQEIADYLANLKGRSTDGDDSEKNAAKRGFAETFLAETDNPAKYEFYGKEQIPAGQSLEGFLFPDTYQVFQSFSATEIITKMLENFDRRLDSELRAQISSSGKSLYEVLTMASILEKEVTTYEDRQIVAGIFYKRMENNWPLESDATVNYATGKSERQPSYQDTLIDSDYNTYKNRGLPPGPICNPGLETVSAALNPIASEYWYYLNDENGQSYFSKTYQEHLANKNKYLKD